MDFLNYERLEGGGHLQRYNPERPLAAACKKADDGLSLVQNWGKGGPTGKSSTADMAKGYDMLASSRQDLENILWDGKQGLFDDTCTESGLCGEAFQKDISLQCTVKLVFVYIGLINAAAAVGKLGLVPQYIEGMVYYSDQIYVLNHTYDGHWQCAMGYDIAAYDCLYMITPGDGKGAAEYALHYLQMVEEEAKTEQGIHEMIAGRLEEVSNMFVEGLRRCPQVAPSLVRPLYDLILFTDVVAGPERLALYTTMISRALEIMWRRNECWWDPKDTCTTLETVYSIAAQALLIIGYLQEKPLFSRQVFQMTDKMGGNVPRNIIAMGFLCFLSDETTDQEKAQKWLPYMLALQSIMYEDGLYRGLPMESLRFLCSLQVLYRRAGRYEEADATAQETLQYIASLWGAETEDERELISPSYTAFIECMSLACRAEVCGRLGRPQEGYAYLDQADEIVKRYPKTQEEYMDELERLKRLRENGLVDDVPEEMAHEFFPY